jgi:hypothetical protein
MFHNDSQCQYFASTIGKWQQPMGCGIYTFFQHISRKCPITDSLVMLQEKKKIGF